MIVELQLDFKCCLQISPTFLDAPCAHLAVVGRMPPAARPADAHAGRVTLCFCKPDGIKVQSDLATRILRQSMLNTPGLMLIEKKRHVDWSSMFFPGGTPDLGKQACTGGGRNWVHPVMQQVKPTLATYVSCASDCLAH